MCIFVYYHLTIMRNWRDIVREQCTRIVFSGLYASVTEIRCYAIIPDGNMTLMTECEETLKRYGNKFTLKGFNVFTRTPVHYAGNFFWMKGSHLKTLNYEGEHNPETWIFENTIGRFVSIYQSSLPDIRFPYLGIGHYFKEYPLSMVVDTDQLNG